MDKKLDYKSVAAWIILGYLCDIMINGAETILKFISNAIAYQFLADSQLKYFSEVIPHLLKLIFWIFLIFVFLKNFDADKVIEKFPKRFAKILAISALGLYILIYGFRIIAGHIVSINYAGSAPPKMNVLEMNALILDAISSVQVIVITIGVIKIVKNNALPLTAS